MEIEETGLSGLRVLTPRRFGDARGWFCETWSARRMEQAGIATRFVQDNHSFSAETGTLRGLHFQAPPHAQAKLVRCTAGALWDVAVDVRTGSPTCGQWVGVELTPQNGRQLLIPEGFLHGFVTTAPNTEMQYRCSDFYAPEADGAVRWDSAALGIDWPLEGPPVLSGKDAVAPDYADWTSPFDWSDDA